MAGFITIDRKILKWEWYQDIKVFHLFLYLILRANWEDGRWKGIHVKRGQVITGRLQLSKDTGLSEMEIRTCLKKLKSTNEITVKSTSKNSVITICKYDYYQNKFDATNQHINQQLIQQVTSNQPTSNQQLTINNTSNNKEEEKKEENIPNLWFLRFYHGGYSLYKSVYNGQSTSEENFKVWVSFIDRIYEKKLDGVFFARMITPHEFSEIFKDGFTDDYWDDTLKKILSTGVKPEHNLYFRIPEFLKYVKQDRSKQSGKGNTAYSKPSSTVGREIKFDKL